MCLREMGGMIPLPAGQLKATLAVFIELAHHRHEPPVVWMPGGVRTEIQLTGADTDAAFCLLVDEPPAGWSLPPHSTPRRPRRSM
jgi:hypothetical protein